uniref:Aldo_ket_red domain-containing protein n=1 Tax=Caenorhabditis japonica TaxID=281687 RepID=A0A8R1HJ50_CAEJA
MDHRDYVRTKMPMIGIGTWQIQSEKVLYDVIDAGLRVGYRFIDTAQVYGNEPAIGRILEKLLPNHGLQRKEIWITSKVSPSNAGAKLVRKSIEKSLENLKTDYIDLMLIHWPGSTLKSEDPKNKTLREESWKVMSEMKEEGKLKAIGVSNFEICHLEELKKTSSVVPAVNQVEYHPHFHQDDLVKYCHSNNVHFQAYSSLGSPTYREKLSADPLIVELAGKYNVSIPVFLLGFAYCQGISVLPRTTNPDHAVNNYQVTKLSISQNDIDNVLVKNLDHKTCWDPRVVV